MLQTCTSLRSRICASSIHASTSSDLCSVTFFNVLLQDTEKTPQRYHNGTTPRDNATIQKTPVNSHTHYLVILSKLGHLVTLVVYMSYLGEGQFVWVLRGRVERAKDLHRLIVAWLRLEHLPQNTALPVKSINQ